MSELNKKVSDNMIKFGIVALTMGIVFLVSGVANAADSNAMGAWTSINLVVEASPGFEVQVEEEYRYKGADSSEAHTSVDIGKTFGSWTTTAGYKNVFGTVSENRPYAGLSLALPSIVGINTGLSTTFEWRDFENFRQRLGLYAQGEIAGFAPYISNELFFNVDPDLNFLGKNRVSIGIAKPITDMYSIEAYYNLDSQFIGETTNNVSAVGLGLNIAL